MKHAKGTRRGVRVKAVLFFSTLAIALAVSLIIPLRPVESVREKRELVKFPAFTVESLANGKYFRGIEDWFSDTFPGRDLFLDLNKYIRDFYGIRTVEIHGEQQQGDDIPDAPFTGN